MLVRNTFAVLAAVAALTALPGCAVMRDQPSAGNIVDDSGITTAVKARFVADKTVAASAINVETLSGTVMLSGFAKNAGEKSNAEAIARGVKGVMSVDNRIAIRP